jgi:glycosyltransferase involved in cell wall biosynthesis
VDTKGFDTFIQAIQQLGERGLQIQAEIVGEGPERENLEGLIHRSGLQDRVKLTGALSHAQTLEKQREADVAVQPCGPGKNGLDGIPVVLMEAMALGVPVVSTRFAGIPELIETDQNGLLVPPGDPTALAEAVSSLLSSPEDARQKALAARATVEREFDAGRNYREKVERVRSLAHPTR